MRVVQLLFRYPRGNGIGVDISAPPKVLEIGKAEILEQPEGADVLLLGLGPMSYFALEAARELESEFGISCSVVNPRFVKPLDEKLLASLIPKHCLTVTIEDHAIQGGFGSAVIEFMSDAGISSERGVLRLGIEDEFIEHGTQAELYKICGFDKDSIVARVREALAKRPPATAKESFKPPNCKCLKRKSSLFDFVNSEKVCEFLFPTILT